MRHCLIFEILRLERDVGRQRLDQDAAYPRRHEVRLKAPSFGPLPSKSLDCWNRKGHWIAVHRGCSSAKRSQVSHGGNFRCFIHREHLGTLRSWAMSPTTWFGLRLILLVRIQYDILFGTLALLLEVTRRNSKSNDQTLISDLIWKTVWT